MAPMLQITNLAKTYATGLAALKDVSLEVEKGEIFALLGPNGAGKTTLISIVCGLVRPSGGTVQVDGHDIVRDYRAARAAIGLVPQELTTDSFESVIDTVRFSRGLFGKPANAAYVEKVLRDLSLWEKRDAKIMTLSGGMKRRLLIAKALSHEPRVLFLDEPSAGVDVELRRDMWRVVRELRAAGTTIILTTHYLEEAEEMADRVGVMRKGSLILVEEKTRLMRQFGRKQLVLSLAAPLSTLPEGLSFTSLHLNGTGTELIYSYDLGEGDAHIARLLQELAAAGVGFTDLKTEQSSLEDIFVDLVRSEP